MSVMKCINKTGYWDCDWASIYARGPIQEFEKDSKEHPEIVSYFFEHYSNFNDRVKINMLNLIRVSNQLQETIPFLDKVSSILETEKDVEILDAGIQLCETLRMETDADISFLRKIDYPTEWLKDYAFSIID